MSKIYLFKDDEIQKSYVFHSPIDKNGVSIDETKEDPLIKVFLGVNRKGKVLTDRLLLISNFLVVSTNLFELLQGSNHQEFKAIPAVLNVGQKQINAEYMIILPLYETDILDHDRSELKTFKQHILSVKKWAVDATKVPDKDLFYVVPGDWVVSEKLKNKITAKKFTGCRFEEIS